MADVVLQYLKQIEDLKYVGYMIIILCGLHTMASCVLFIYINSVTCVLWTPWDQQKLS